jgi:hypothetical protein
MSDAATPITSAISSDVKITFMGRLLRISFRAL